MRGEGPRQSRSCRHADFIVTGETRIRPGTVQEISGPPATGTTGACKAVGGQGLRGVVRRGWVGSDKEKKESNRERERQW